MRGRSAPVAALAALAAAPLVLGCADEAPGEVVSGLQLEDVNETSATFGELVELGPQGGAATAWYFTHAT